MASTTNEYLSKRAQVLVGEKNFLDDHFTACMKNPWSINNPQGIVNLGTAQNYLCQELLVTKFQEEGFYEFDASMLHYYAYAGGERTRKIIANFIRKYMKADYDVHPDNIAIVLGSCSAMDMIGHIIADPGDVILCPTPCYTRIRGNFYERSLVNIYPIHLSSKFGLGETIPFELTVDRVKSAYESAINDGKTVKGMIILNPNNPLGNVFSRRQLLPILEFLASKQLYCIFDEIYALSTFNVGTNDEDKFDSVLSFWTSVPDPQRIIWFWGLSKDFGNAGIRVSFMYSQNLRVLECVRKLIMFQCVPLLLHKMVEKFFLDEAWIEDTYLPTNLSRLKENYNIATSCLDSYGIPFLTTRAGIFIFVDFRQFLTNQTFLEERALFKKLLDAGLYVVPGETSYCNEPGWFRIIFSVPKGALQVGLSRLGNVLTNMRLGDQIGNE